MTNPYAYDAQTPVDRLGLEARATFIARTYLHLFGAILAFVAIEIALFTSGAARPIAEFAFQTHWGLILGAFMLVGWLARGAAHKSSSLAVQYAALAGYVVAQALIFVPLLYVAESYSSGVIGNAAVVTLGGFAALTFVVLWTRKDFSFMRSFLMFGGIAALIGIGVSLFTSFQLGIWFDVGMVLLAGGSILYDTSNVLHHYPEDRYVGASVELFASVALLFWYVLRLFMSRD